MVDTITVVEWDENYTHHIHVAQYVPTAEAINGSLDAELNTLILGPFNSDDAIVDEVRVRQAVYMPPPFAPTMLVGYHTPVQAWTSLQVDIVAAGQEFDCRTLVNWLRVALV